MIFYVCWQGLTQKQCNNRTKSTFCNKAPSKAIIYKNYPAILKISVTMFWRIYQEVQWLPKTLKLWKKKNASDHLLTCDEIEASLNISSIVHLTLHDYLNNKKCVCLIDSPQFISSKMDKCEMGLGKSLKIQLWCHIINAQHHNV